MSRDKVLPPKLSIRKIKDYLDMSILSLKSPYQQLCDHVNGKDFNLYVKNNQLNLFEIEDIADNGTLLINANSKPINGITADLVVRSIKYEKPISVFDDNYDATSINRESFVVEKVSNQGIEYYIAKVGSKSIGVSFSEDDFYSLRDEIINYRKDDLYKDTLDKNMLDAQFLDNIPPDDIPPYLDQESDFYSEELDIAIQIHNAINIQKYGKPHLTREDNVESWLDNNRPELKHSDAMIRRIASIISLKRIKRK